MYLLDAGRIQYLYIDYVIAAPKTITHEYDKKHVAVLRPWYHDAPAKYKSMQHQLVGRTYRT